MKKQKIIALVFFTMALYQCTNNEPLEQNDNSVISQFIYENYNTTNTPNTVNNRRVYNLENNRIITTSQENLETGFTANRTYMYTNNRLAEINRFSNGALLEKKSFGYDTNGNLTQYLRETIENSDTQAFYIKQDFMHTQDTIFGTSSQSEDGIDYVIVERQKIVLDTNTNAVFKENYSVVNDETTRTELTYDVNNNIISSIGYLQLDNGNFVNASSSSYTFGNGINTLALIYEATFGKQVLMLSQQHIDNSSAINYYNSKYVTQNNLESYSSTFFGNGNFAPEFTHTYNDNNYSTFSDYRFLVNGNLLTRFTYEFIFQ